MRFRILIGWTGTGQTIGRGRRWGRLIVIGKHVFDVFLHGWTGLQKRFTTLDIFDSVQFSFCCAWYVSIFDRSLIQFTIGWWFGRGISLLKKHNRSYSPYKSSTKLLLFTVGHFESKKCKKYWQLHTSSLKGYLVVYWDLFDQFWTKICTFKEPEISSNILAHIWLYWPTVRFICASYVTCGV